MLLAEAVAFYLVQIRDQGAGAFGLAFIIIFLINIPALLAGAFYSHDIIILSLGSFAVSWAISVAIKYAVLRIMRMSSDIVFEHILSTVAISNVVSYAVLAVVLVYLPASFLGRRSVSWIPLSRVEEILPNAESYVKRGEIYLERDEAQRAIQDLDEAIRLNPKYEAAYIDRGRAYQALGKSEQAQRDFDKAKELKAK